MIANRNVHSHYLLVIGLLTERLSQVISCCYVVTVVTLKSCLTVLVKIMHGLTILEMLA